MAPAKSPKLKVYRTPIGFHDAYVAAASQAAALRAWGASANLFARGVAEVVTDPALSAAPLAAPGSVVKVARGSAAEHLAALPKGKGKKKAVAVAKAARTPKPKPRPSRGKYDAAEAALAALLVEQERALAAFEAAQAKAEALRDRARDAYRSALAEWEG
ncbi:MAG: hypothetical protein V4659_04330 [Pseudomonadota bacterium]